MTARNTVYMVISILLVLCMVWVYSVLVQVARKPTPAFKWRLRILLALLIIPAMWETVTVFVFFPTISQMMNFAKILVVLGVFLFCLTTGLAYLGFQAKRLILAVVARRKAGQNSAHHAPASASATALQSPALVPQGVPVPAPVPAPALVAAMPLSPPASAPASVPTSALTQPVATASAVTTAHVPPTPTAEPAPLAAPAPTEVELSRRRWLRNACFGFAGMTALTGMGAVWTESIGLQVRKITLHCPRLPAAFRGYRVLQISDVHAGPYMGLETMRATRAAAEALKSDLVVFTGDQVDTHWNQLPAFLEAFNGLRGRDGVYAILGNHDYIAGARRVQEGLEAAGFPVLVNEAVRIQRGGQSIVLAGLDDLWHGIEGPDPRKAFLNATPGDFKLTLMHNPNSFEAVADAGADLMLAGHTHGGQINMVADIFSPARLFSPYVQGLFTHNTAQMYVNVGVGFVGIPVRIGVPAEIVEFTLV